MQYYKYYRSELLFKPIFYEDTLIGFVRDVIVNPFNGIIIGFAIKTDCSRYIAYEDCFFLIDRFFCNDRDPVIDSEDVIGTNQIIKDGLLLFNKPVESRNGKKIGILTDYRVDLSVGMLDQIVVSQFKFLWINLGYTRYIDHRKIYEIEPEKVIIKNEREKIKSKAKARSFKKGFKSVIKKEAEPVYGSASIDR